MKNLTLAVDDELLANYRLHAFEQRTTVNALVRKHMEEVTETAARRKTALERLTKLSLESEAYDAANPVELTEAARFSREDTYTGRRFQPPRS